MKNRLFLFANDAASANVTIAYAYLYGSFYDTILAYPYGVAKSLYKEHIPTYISNNTQVTFNTLDTVVTGSSGINSSFELNMIKQAKISNVHKCIMIIDNISNFNMRFTIKNQIIEKSYLADEIWVFDKNFQSNATYINQNIIYKENIYDIYLKELLKKNQPIATHPFVKKNQNNYIVILTEYLYELYGLKFGFTEYNMVECILQAIDDLELQIPVFLKLHPREHKNKFNILMRKYNHLNILKDDCNIQELIYYSRIVLGINSSVFIESLLYKKPTYSIQINSKTQMNLLYLKEENIIYTQEEIKNILNFTV